MYVGIKDVPPVGGLRSALRGELPSGRASRQSFAAVQSAAVGLAKAATSTGRLTTVYGIRVDESIAPAVKSLVEGARPNLLTGGGYRSSEQQAALRKTNGCTCSDSSDCCRTPTAPVGKSMHEVGLAVDFSWNGSLIRSRKSAGFAYLSANAPGVGLQNLPSEPWHWSTNGH
jgi:D-alanyl-D-alanine carboxypeptidase